MVKAPPKATFSQPEKIGNGWKIKIVDQHDLIYYRSFKTEDEANKWLKRGPDVWPRDPGSTK
jgi:hypothetical protein